MEILSLKHLKSPVPGDFPMTWHQNTRLLGGVFGVSLLKSGISKQIGHPHFVPCSKEFAFQDFQGFAKPQQLLPATEVNIRTESSLEEIYSSFNVDESCSFYIVQLQTSRDFGSSLSDSNAAILLCLIDVNGDSILQRIPSTRSENPGRLKAMAASELLHFQRGSVDKITFKGPKLGEVEALWIGLESGCWRLGGVTLTVITPKQFSSTSTEDSNKLSQYSGLQYEFVAEDILLGEGESASMAELRPCLVTELDGLDSFTIFNTDISRSTLLSNQNISNEESMREYADLKFSLLLYDAMLILTGSSILAFSATDRAAVTFFIGGIGGFLYLLLLQNSVDGLPTPTLSAMNTKRNPQVFGGFKGPLSTLALTLALAIIAVKYGFGSETIVLTPQELFVGVAGFLTCKIAVVLAAFKPVQIGLKEK
ncbi:lipase/lipooxygenase, PLAT/LH2 family protein isoform X2 [Tasmannia lanceolata]|uniref:lipase/lipooxygenase, PLAT/LH2 family protein isoform X2 n=1 Tax=Tasmannia lanceolata TaxID=3420 RepID=UPI0040636382